MKFAILHTCLVLLLAVCVNCYMHFQEEIPNGDYIPHSCKPNFVWKGVGHESMSGGGKRNQFGIDFFKAGNKWTKTLCQTDSDQDGKTNGEELGDPNCAWTKGAIPASTTDITHPGICDPFGSAQCAGKNDWVNCDSDEFKCPAIEEEDVFSRDLVFPWTNVPDKGTTYMCMGFDLPSDGDYHMIATMPLINETRVMHHIVLIACLDEAENITEPRECSMGLTGCTTTIGLWTLGLPGECFYREAGVRIGKMGIKKAVLQFHWTNPEERDDLWDATGMRLFFTNNLRRYDAGTYSTGQVYLEIPPATPKVVQHSTCSSKCTRKTINGSIFLTTGLNHMHYLGVSQHVKLIRQNGSELMLTDDKHYSYDTPVLHTYDPPIEVKAGDKLETVCTYRSLSRKKTAFFGEGTFDEMCFGIFNFYPTYAVKTAFGGCYTRKDFEYCDLEDWNCGYTSMLDFSNNDTRALVDKVMNACSYMGDCLHGCRKVVNDIMNNHACFKDGAAENLMFRSLQSKKDNDTMEALNFVSAMKSCDCASENSIAYTYKIPEVEDNGGKIPEVEDNGGKIPAVEDNGGKILEVEDNGGKIPEVENNGGAHLVISMSMMLFGLFAIKLLSI